MLNHNPSMRFFHASAEPLEIGTILAPKMSRGVEDARAGSSSEILLERLRPPGKLPRHLSVFMFTDVDSGMFVGMGDRNYIYEVIPLGTVERNDMGLHPNLGDATDEKTIRQIAAYWRGNDDPSAIWEYRAPAAQVISLVKEPSYYGKRAAGILLVSDDGYFFSVKRSEYVREPHTWGIPGGAAEDSELPGETAIREVSEELGSLPDNINYVGATKFIDGNFTYITFIYQVSKANAESWEIELNWENEDAGWFLIEQPPTPLHFGLKYVLESGAELIRQAVKE